MAVLQDITIYYTLTSSLHYSHHYAQRIFEIKEKYCSMTCLKLEEERLVSFLTSINSIDHFLEVHTYYT